MGIGPDERRRTADWKKPLRWDKQVGEARPRVLCSLCDPFEEFRGSIKDAQGKTGVIWPHNEVVFVTYPNYMPIEQLLTLDNLRADFFDLIDRTPRLTWILATKRPENVRRMWPLRSDGSDSGESDEFYLPNVWLLYSASDQPTLEAGLPHLLACRDLVPVLGVSLEPLLGPIRLGFRRAPTDDDYVGWSADGPIDYVETKRGSRIDWVIVGAESGPKRRPCEVEWITDIADQCREAGVACFVKQDSAAKPGTQGRIPDEYWRIKEFPVVSP